MFVKSMNEGYSIIKSARIIIDPKRFLVSTNDKDLILYPKEFEVLYFLVSHGEWVMSAEQIYLAVWHEKLYGYEHVIYNTISQIRKKAEYARYNTDSEK